MVTNGHVDFIWSIAKRLRGAFKQHEYGSIILPLTLLRRLDQVLAPTREKVLAEAAKYEGRGLNLDPILKRASGQLFYNASKLTLDKVLADPDHVATHLREYIAGFDPVVRDIFEAFKFDASISALEKVDRLYSVLGKFLDPELDLHPDAVPNEVMGDIFEELIRRFSEVSNETAGEHFTPREVVRLCAELVLAGDQELFTTPGIVRSVYDPACGTGGMLSVVEELVRDRNPKARLVLFGQELNPESWAVCRAEMLVKGQDPSRIAPGSTLSADGTAGRRFDFMLANPPFGVDWSDDYDTVVNEHEQRGFDGRFGAGYPKKGDGALLFLQTMLSKMKPPGEDAGSRLAIIFNESPLFGGGAGSDESNIRQWIIENDWLEAVVALPTQLFYNTGLQTYIWVLTDRKEPRRHGRVQLIDARDLWEPMPKSYGDKRRRLSPQHIEEVLKAREGFQPDGLRSKVRANTFFGYRRVTVERPLRVRYRAGDAAVMTLQTLPAFQKLVAPGKAGASVDDGERLQSAMESVLRALNGLRTDSRTEMEQAVAVAAKDLKLAAPLKKAIWTALSERDATAPVVTRQDGRPEPDPELRDIEHVPLDEEVDAYFEREVKPFDALAWPDAKDAKVGYEIPLTRLFFRERPVRALEAIERDLADLDLQMSDLRGRLAHQRAVALAHALRDRPRNARLGFIGRWLSGGTPARDDPANWAGEFPWASSKDLHAERLTDTIEHVTEEAALAGSRIVDRGTLLVATRGMSLAKRLPMALVMERMAFNQDLKAIVPDPHVDGEYLRLVLRAFEPEVLSLTVEAAHGTKRIETHTLKAFRIPLPSLPEQQEIVRDTLAVEETLFELDSRLLRERELLAEHRHALISAAVAGSAQSDEEDAA
jgi:type I restriction enzyme M protein